MHTLKTQKRNYTVSSISTNHSSFKFHKGSRVRVECQDPETAFTVIDRVEGLAWPHYIVETDFGARLRVSQLELSRLKKSA
jgi:hypothetical protein